MCVYAIDDDPLGVFVDVKYDAKCFVEVFLLVVICMRCVCLTESHSDEKLSYLRVCMYDGQRCVKVLCSRYFTCDASV